MSATSPRVPATAIIGLQFGDEGKGQITDLLSQNHDIVVRYNGGANAGHSVHIVGERYALHQVPVGVLTPGRLNVLANGVALDPEGFIAELATLRKMGVSVDGNLRISDRAHLVMPYHKTEEQLRELLAKASLGPERMLGTTGRGIGPCYADKCSRDTALRVADLLDDGLTDRIAHIVTIKSAILGALSTAAGVAFESFTNDDVRSLCEKWAAQLRPFVCDTSTLLNNAMATGRRVLFEGAHACLLDVDHGTYPFVTSSNSSAVGIAAGAGVPLQSVGTIVGVAKLYTSRVGNGPFPTETSGDVFDELRVRAGEFGTSTGRPRRLGWLDIPAVRRAAEINGVSSLCLTGLSMLKGLPSIKVCVDYRHCGDALEPVYEELSGFDEPIGNCRSFDALPQAARAMVDLVEQHVAPVRWVCVGKQRDQVLER